MHILQNDNNSPNTKTETPKQKQKSKKMNQNNLATILHQQDQSILLLPKD